MSSQKSLENKLSSRLPKNRLEAFSDAVIAIIITIMVLELHPPMGTGLRSLMPLLSTFLSYVLSFLYLAIYWNNHHHMLHAAQHINGRIMWADLYLLFWLSLFPFVTGWVGKTHAASWPLAIYGFVLLMASIAYLILQYQIIHLHGKDSLLAQAIGHAWKEKFSTVCYVAAIIFAFIAPWFSILLYVLVACTWIIPDRRIERLAASVSGLSD